MLAICPLCGRTIPFEGDVPPNLSCPHCHKALRAEKSGMAVHLYTVRTPSEDETAVKALQDEKDPVKKYRALTALSAQYPDSLAVSYALLMHGRLHERSPKKLDFSVIKCYLLHPYEEPKLHATYEKEAFARELFAAPQLERCLKLADNTDAFMTMYLTELCEQYIDLFLMGSSKYGHSIMGLILPGKQEKTLAAPVAKMMRLMAADPLLTCEQSAMLQSAMLRAFENRLHDTSYLSALL